MSTRFPRRDAFSVRAVSGGWRAEKRKILMARALRHADASRRANRDVCGNGPRFSSRVGNDFRLDTSASSWQGLLVVPGGAPMPPECLVAQGPQAPHLVPLIATPRESAP
jgi:hypothetical protein